jgi:hypothetical protein
MSLDDFRQRANAVRGIPLEMVLLVRGALRDRCDKSKWHTERGTLSVTGAKFTNWQQDHGGGGAIDLVMHLAAVDCHTAVAWLEGHIHGSYLAPADARLSGHPQSSVEQKSPPSLQLPPRNDRLLGRVQEYLTRRRHLAASLLQPLIESGRLYADHRGNAVFLLVAGKPNRPIGAELRGTGPRVWRGMAPGTQKDLGYFWIGSQGSQEIVLCESAIDAMSCYQMHAERICISTSGVRANPPWLTTLIARGYHIHCGFDTDAPGEAAADRMIALHPRVHRLRPPAHDWNDALAPSR